VWTVSKERERVGRCISLDRPASKDSAWLLKRTHTPVGWYSQGGRRSPSFDGVSVDAVVPF
jgi:hypothetical protein